MTSRRSFLIASALAGAGLLLPWRFNLKPGRAYIPGGDLDPLTISKYVSPLVKPPAFKRLRKTVRMGGKNAEYYELAVRQFQQQILPSPHPATTVWSYGPAGDPRTVAQGGQYHYPAFSLETKWKQPTVVKWINGLVDPATGAPLPHLLAVDPSLHWANPIGHRDMRPDPIMNPDYWSHPYIGADGRYTGPVPMVTHVHGAHTYEQWDGYAEAWYLPAAAQGDMNVMHSEGSFYDTFKQTSGALANRWQPGAAAFMYPNDQRATTLWYHDHTLGMTRLNVYAGPAGFFLLRGGPDDAVIDTRFGTAAVLPGPAPTFFPANPFGTYYEIPIAIQDRSFNADGSLFYPDNRAFFEELDPSQLQIPFAFDNGGWGYGCDDVPSDVAPIWNPEFFGNTMVVNGQTWPYLDVEQRRYRFRLLNGCNSRFLILDFSNIPGVEVWQIGAEGGFLAAPVNITELGNRLLMAPAERADVIVDFTNVATGMHVLTNLGPDEPFGGGEPPDDFDVSDPDTTGQIMAFNVIPALAADPTTPPMYLQLPAVAPFEPGAFRDVSLNEMESESVFVEDEDGNIVFDCDSDTPFGPTEALLGTMNPDGTSHPLMWMEDISETPAQGSVEEWTIYNFTMDAHPIHVHQVQFQVVNREGLMTDEEGMAMQPAMLTGAVTLPEAWESGFKDTVIAYPGQATRIRMKFDLPGLFVWHCHIVEHEDNEMMRPFYVQPG